MNYLSNTSKARLSTCDSDIQMVIETAIKLCPIDFGVAEGYRTIERQQELYNKRDANGKRLTKIDGINKKGNHNYFPSRAIDLYAYVNGKASWEAKDMIFIAGFITAVAEMLRDAGAIKSKFRWGGNWDQDGEIISDQDFQDLPHFEITNYESRKENNSSSEELE